MGLIYSADDSSRLIDGLNTNIEIAKMAVDELVRASQTLTNEIGMGKALDGIAFRAGSDLFTDLIIPTVARADMVFSQMREHLAQYSYANDAIAGEGYLNEDLLIAKQWAVGAVKALTDALVNDLHWLAGTTQVIAPVLADYLNDTAQWLSQFSDTLQQTLEAIDQKLKLLHQFEQAVATIFNDDLQQLKLVVQSVSVLNETRVQRDGTYTLPAGIDKQWFTELQENEDNQLYEFLQPMLALDDAILDGAGLSEEQKKWYKDLKAALKYNPAKLYKMLQGSRQLEMIITQVAQKYPKLGAAFEGGLAMLAKLSQTKIGKGLKVAGKITSAAGAPLKYTISNSNHFESWVKNKAVMRWIGIGASVVEVINKVDAVMTFTTIAVTGLVSGIKDAVKEQSIGKGIIGGVIEMVKSIGPLEGMVFAGAIAGAVSTGIVGWPLLLCLAAGAGVGLGIQWFFDKNPDIKETAFKVYDDVKKPLLNGPHAILTKANQLKKTIAISLDAQIRPARSQIQVGV